MFPRRITFLANFHLWWPPPFNSYSDGTKSPFSSDMLDPSGFQQMDDPETPSRFPPPPPMDLAEPSSRLRGPSWQHNPEHHHILYRLTGYRHGRYFLCISWSFMGATKEPPLFLPPCPGTFFLSIPFPAAFFGLELVQLVPTYPLKPIPNSFFGLTFALFGANEVRSSNAFALLFKSLRWLKRVLPSVYPMVVRPFLSLSFPSLLFCFLFILPTLLNFLVKRFLLLSPFFQGQSPLFFFFVPCVCLFFV